MVTVGPSDETSTGISFPVVSFREIFADLSRCPGQRWLWALSALVGIFIEPFTGDVPIEWGGSSTGGTVCKTKDYRANVSFALAAY